MYSNPFPLPRHGSSSAFLAMWNAFKPQSPIGNVLRLVTIALCQPHHIFIINFLMQCSPASAMASSFTRFLDHTQRRATVGRTPLDEWSARRRDLHLTRQNKHNRQTSMPPVGFFLLHIVTIIQPWEHSHSAPKWASKPKHLYISPNIWRMYLCVAIRTHDRSRRAAVDLRLDRAATGTGYRTICTIFKSCSCCYIWIQPYAWNSNVLQWMWP
jgi:hypothetical protein